MEGELGGMVTNTRAGIRYERTDITSTSAVAIPETITWTQNNDFRIDRSDEVQPFSETASYSHLLPSLDFSIDLLEDVKARASFSQTIARPSYGNLYAGPGPNQPTGSILINPSNRAPARAEPGLVPLESDNLDFALEWYFAPSSFVALTTGTSALTTSSATRWCANRSTICAIPPPARTHRRRSTSAQRHLP